MERSHDAIADPSGVNQPDRNAADSWLAQPRTQVWLSVVAGVLLGIGVIARLIVGRDTLPTMVFALPIWASLGIGMFYGVIAAIVALKEKRIDIDILMVVAAVLAALVGHPEEGALLLVLFSFASALEELAMERTEREINALEGIMPDRAIVLVEGRWVETTPEDVSVGDEIRIRPGDRVPVDSVVLEGNSSMDESTLTGESLLRDVGPGDPIYAGTINTSGVLRAKVSKEASQSSVQRVLELVTQARASREPLARLIDRLGQPYSIGVMVVSAAVFVLWWLGFGEAWGDAAMTAITLLIVASPCALVLATPTASLSAIARGARAGVLFKGGESIHRLSQTGAICFDKTGTLTRGEPVFVEMLVHTHGGVGRPVATMTLLEIARQLEADSTHPVAGAIARAADAQLEAARRARPRQVPACLVESITSVPGRGIAGECEGRRVRIGSESFVSEIVDQAARAWLTSTLASVRQRGQLGIALGVARCGTDARCASCRAGSAMAQAALPDVIEQASAAQAPEAVSCAAVLVLEDALREGADRAVEALHRLGIEPLVMLTGDNEQIAARVAAEVGLDDFKAGLMPQDKIAAVEALKASLSDEVRAGRRSRGGVAVIGDGVNDAPALAAADVSIAIGSIGADAALESADIVLLNDDLGRIPRAIALARATRRTIAVNISIALGVIVLMGAAVLIGSRTGHDVPLAVGVVAHEGGTVVVVLNSIRLLMVSMSLGRSPAHER